MRESQQESEEVATPPGDRRGFWARHRTRLHALAYLATIVVATPRWPVVLAGLPLILVGLALRTWALGHLTKDEVLCTSGPYAYTRNPLYLGSLFILAGLCVAANNPYLAGAAVVLAALVYFFTVRSEESVLSRLFGAEYEAYRQRVPRLIPRLRRAEPANPSAFSWDLARAGKAKELAAWVLLLFVILILKALVGPSLGMWPYAG